MKEINCPLAGDRRLNKRRCCKFAVWEHGVQTFVPLITENKASGRLRDLADESAQEN